MKILLPIDGSEPSKQTLEWATTLFSKELTHFYILTVVGKVVPELTAMEYEVEDALKILEEGQMLLKNKGFTVKKAEYVIGNPSEEICKYADEIDADQIVIGSHGRTGFSKFLLGSISSAVFEQAKRPVFVYKNKTLEKVTA